MKNFIVTKDNIPTLQVNDPASLGEYTLIDVRRPDEFNAELGHIEGAKLVTLGPELDLYLKNEARNKKILFICRSSARSGKATVQAMGLGFKDVLNMEGGMLYWNEKNFPIKRDAKIKCIKNIHPLERTIRIILGAVFVSLAFVGPENKWFLLGLLPLLTGLIGWCPPYQLLGINTLGKKSSCSI